MSDDFLSEVKDMAKSAFETVAGWFTNEPSPEAMQNAIQAGYNPDSFYNDLTIYPYDHQHSYTRPDMPEEMKEMTNIKGFIEQYKLNRDAAANDEARENSQKMIDRLQNNFQVEVNKMIENGTIGQAVDYSNAHPPETLTWEQHQAGQNWQPSVSAPAAP